METESQQLTSNATPIMTSRIPSPMSPMHVRNKTDMAISPRPNSELIVEGKAGPQSSGTKTPTLNGVMRGHENYAYYKPAHSISSKKFKDLENSIKGMSIFRQKVNFNNASMTSY